MAHERGTQERRIVGVFDTDQGAVKAIEDLKRQGYTTDEISVISKNRDDLNYVTDETDTKAPEGAAAGAATGGVVGGLTGLLAGLGLLVVPGIGPVLAAGPIAATLTGLVIGAGTGGIVGGLIGLGIPEDEAKRYDDDLDAGRILVLVDTDPDRRAPIYDTFRMNNTLNSDTYIV